MGTPDGRVIISKPMTRELMSILHRGSHWGPQAMCDEILRNYRCVGSIPLLNKYVGGGAVTCQRINKKMARKHMREGRLPRFRPF